MNASGTDSGDKVVVDPADLEIPAPRSFQPAIGRAEQPRGIAKGTREQVAVGYPIPAITTPIRGPRDLGRDPVQVLRTWPHSKLGPEAPPPPDGARRATMGAPAARRVDDKIALAHLALDLYREIGQLEAVAPRSHPAHAGDTACATLGCVARTNALRGALLEACLLVQRVALTPAASPDLEDRIRELLDVLER